MAEIKFYFAGKLKTIVHVFISVTWTGTLMASSEMRSLHWFKVDQLPYNKMWPADKIWLPEVFKGRTFKASFWYSADGRELVASPEIRNHDFS